MSNEKQISKEEIIVDKIIFSINEEEKTAEVIGNKSDQFYIIPKSVTYKNQEFTVTSINKNSFNSLFIKSLKFPEDSEVQKIEKNAFQHSHIENMSIPASVSNLEEGWDSKTFGISNLSVDLGNQHYKKYENLILGKNDSKSDNFDLLIFASRKVQTITIPPIIKRITSYSFSTSVIEKIVIPSSVKEIGEYSFSNCFNLHEIEFTSDSNLQIIESNAFYLSSIESLLFPANLSELKNGWCNMTKKLTKVTVDKKNQHFRNDGEDDKLIIGKSDNFDVLIYAARDIQTVTIPSNVKRIASYAFSYSTIKSIIIPSSVTVIDDYAFSDCSKLKQVEIPRDSQLTTINSNAFHSAKIKKIFIPQQVTQIGKNAFACCNKLQQIEIADDSKLTTIGSNAFMAAPIESIEIPEKVCSLDDGWCNYTFKKVTINKNNKYYKEYEKDKNLIVGRSNVDDVFDALMFANRDITKATIPPSIKYISPHAFSYSKIESIIIPASVTCICNCAFYCCKRLKRIEIPLNSQLVEIGSDAFYFSCIKEIFIPVNVTQIKIYTFNLCKELRYVDIHPDSQLKTIDEDAFSHSALKCFYIPSLVTQINENAFYECCELQIIEVGDGSSLTKETLKFIYCKKIMVPANLRQNFA